MRTIIIMWALLAVAFVLVGCATTTVTLPDGTVTVTNDGGRAFFATLAPDVLAGMQSALEAELAHRERLTAQQIAAKQERLEAVIAALRDQKAAKP